MCLGKDAGHAGVIVDRRLFLKLAGFAVAASAFEAQPAAAAAVPTVAAEPVRQLGAASPASAGASSVRWNIRTPGTYLISGTVRLDAPLVEISGIANTKTISWSGLPGETAPVTSFLTYEQFDRPGLTPDIQVRGGRIESLSITPVDFQ
jgi:hypothetical protein